MINLLFVSILGTEWVVCIELSMSRVVIGFITQGRALGAFRFGQLATAIIKFRLSTCLRVGARRQGLAARSILYLG